MAPANVIAALMVKVLIPFFVSPPEPLKPPVGEAHVRRAVNREQKPAIVVRPTKGKLPGRGVPSLRSGQNNVVGNVLG